MHAFLTHGFPTAQASPSTSPTDPEQFLQFPTNPSSQPWPIIYTLSPIDACTTFSRVHTQASTSVTGGNHMPLSYSLLAPVPTIIHQLSSNSSAGDHGRHARLFGGTSDSSSSHGDLADDVIGSVSNQCCISLSSSMHSHHSPCGSSLVHRQRRGANKRHTVQRATRLLYEGGVSCTMTSVSAFGSDDEPVPGLDTRGDKDFRRQQVESKQRRQNNLCGGFARLKEALPTCHEKCSKLVLLERAALYIHHLEARLREDCNVVGALGLVAHGY